MMSISTKSESKFLIQLSTLNIEKEGEYLNNNNSIFGNTPSSFNKLCLSLTQEREYYTSERAKLETLFKKLLDLNTNSVLQCRNELNRLKTAQQKLETKHCTAEAFGLLLNAEHLRKQSNYLSKIKSCTKIHNYLNERLSKELHIVKSELGRSQNRMANMQRIPTNEIKSLKKKIEIYEKELLKFQKKYPWLKEPHCNLPNVAKETEILKTLRQEKERFLKVLDIYQGLKPDKNEAQQQLVEIKRRYMNIS